MCPMHAPVVCARRCLSQLWCILFPATGRDGPKWRYCTLEIRALPVDSAESIDLEHRAYVYDDEAVFWELNCVYIAFHCQRKSVKISNEIQKDRPLTETVCEALGLVVSREHQP